MRRLTLLIAVTVIASFILASNGDTSRKRPFIALAHPGQVQSPTMSTTSNLTAFLMLDTKTRELTFTLSEGDVELVWGIHGPAAPGETAPDIASGQWPPGPITTTPLTAIQVKHLRRGLLYIRFFQPSALPEFPRAMRGQILPISGVRY